MQKKLLVMVFIFGAWSQLYSEAVSFAVPKQCLIEKASLVLLMLDGLGNECVGMCQLDEEFESRKIVQQDLHMAMDSTFDHYSESIDVTHALQPRDNEVLLHVEFEKNLQILRILLIKDSLLSDDPFNILSISVNNPVEEFDEFDDLLDGVDIELVETAPAKKLSKLQKYKLYLELYLAIQYSSAKRKINSLVSWWNN